MTDPMLTEREYDLILILKRLIKDVDAATAHRFSRSKTAGEMWQRVEWSITQAKTVLKRIEPE